MPKFDFSNVGGAKLSERGEPLTPNVRDTGVKDEKGNPVLEKITANYVLQVKRCIAKVSRAKANLFIVETEVVESDNPAHPKGSKRTWMQDVDIDAGPGALKGFVVACIGIDHKTAEGKEQIEALADEKVEMTIDGKTQKIDKFSAILTEALEDSSDPNCKNGFEGTLIKCEVKEINTKPKKAGDPPGKFNLHTFSPAAPQPAAAQ